MDKKSILLGGCQVGSEVDFFVFDPGFFSNSVSVSVDSAGSKV